MTTQTANILLFKTNIRTDSARSQLKQLMEQFSGIERWSIDCEDVDCVLRIVCQDLHTAEVIRSVRHMGFDCAELD
jgi:hypothetical protein